MSFPFIRQLDESDCGAACLAMIARYYHKDIGIGTIREYSSTTREGASFLGLKQAAEQLDFFTNAARSPDRKLPESLPVPCIVHLFKDQVFHFVVLYRVSRVHVLIAEPDEGRRKVSRSDF